MSNRLLALLILVGFGGAIYGFYLYFYVYYKGNLEIKSNLDNYSVTIYSDTVKRSFAKNCETLSCLFVGIPPVEYTLTATASGYVDITINATIPKNNTSSINIAFEKDITLKKVENIFVAKLSPEQKVAAFQSKKLYKLIDNKAGVFYITRQDGTIHIANDNGNIGSFNNFTGTKRDIVITTIKGSSDSIWIKIGNESYIYHLSYKQFSNLDIKNIKYIKKSQEYNFFIITDQQLYEYSPNSNTLSLSGKEIDFTIYNEQYIYLNNTSGKSVIKTENKILLQTDMLLEKIHSDSNTIYLENSDGTLYSLEGFE